MWQLPRTSLVLALVMGAAGVASAADDDGVIDPWSPARPAPSVAPRWNAPVGDVVDPWQDDQPKLAVKAPLVDPWKRAAKPPPPRGKILDPWASGPPTAAFPDVGAEKTDRDGLVDPWPEAKSNMPTARFEDTTIVDPWK